MAEEIGLAKGQGGSGGEVHKTNNEGAATGWDD